MYADKWEGNAKSGWGGISPCHCRRWGRLLQHWQAPGSVDKKQFREKGSIKAGYLHDQILTPPYELRLSVDDGLEEPQVLHMLAMALDAMDKVLNNLLVHFVAQDGVVLNLFYITFTWRHIMCWLDTWKIAHMVFAWSRSGFRNSSRCLWRST